MGLLDFPLDDDRGHDINWKAAERSRGKTRHDRTYMALLLFFSSLFSFFSLFLSLLFSLSLSLSSLSTPSLPLIAISQLSDYRNFPIITQCHCVMTPNPV
jgi:hypothetical protein